MKLKITVNDVPYTVDVEVEEDRPVGLGSIVMGGGAAAPVAAAAAAPAAAASSAVTAPLAGSVSRVLVEAGDQVTAGQVVLILEAMKMETEIAAPKAGKVTKILVEKGTAVQGDQVLIEIG